MPSRADSLIALLAALLTAVPALAGVPHSATPAAALTELPRYLLSLGRQLTYQVNFVEKRTSTTQPTYTGETLRATVVRINSDGSSHLVWGVEKFYQEDIFPDGRPVTEPWVNEATVAFFLPLLPANDRDLGHGWAHTYDARFETDSFSPLSDSAGTFVFKNSVGGLLHKTYGSTEELTFRFDRSRHIVTHVQEQLTQAFGLPAQRTATWDLVSDTIPAPAQARKLGKELDAFFNAYCTYLSQLSSAPSSPDIEPALAKARVDLVTAAAGATLPDIRADYEKLLANHDQRADEMRRYAKFKKQYAQTQTDETGKPAFAFSTTDLDGKPHKLTGYRGKVVVLDFWYRGCFWCMYAMPQIKQIVTDLKDQPVVVLGMNVDADENDARFVVNVQQLNYPTLRSSFDEAKKYGIDGYPTLIIIDQQGIIRDVKVGYSPSLRLDVEKSIRALLKPPAS